MPGLCHPYGAGIECTCTDSGQPVHCLPILDYEQGVVGEGEMYQEGDYMVDQEELLGRAEVIEWTEIILAVTFLIVIILLFMA